MAWSLVFINSSSNRPQQLSVGPGAYTGRRDEAARTGTTFLALSYPAGHRHGCRSFDGGRPGGRPGRNLSGTHAVALLGMVAASVLVPLLMVRDDVRYRGKQLGWRHAVFVIAVIAFVVLSLPATNALEPHWYTVLTAAAIAVSALVLPGLSGSLVLLTVGLYEPTLRAVEARDLGYLGVFASGMVIGLIVIVQILKWLLDNHHAATLIMLTGVMLGALRALWPYQADDGALLPIGESFGLNLVLGVIGAAVVLVMIALDRKVSYRAPQPVH